MKLRPYQVDADKALLELELAGYKNLILQAPTGSGKTAMACCGIARDTKLGRRTLVLAHRWELIDQMSKSLLDWGVEHGITNAGRQTSSSSLVQVASIQSLDSSVALPYLSGNDRIVVDECHRSDAAKITRHYPNIRRLGLSATPLADRDGSGKPSRALVGYEHIHVAATPRQLEEWGYIVPIKIFAPPLPSPELEHELYGEEVSARERVMGNAAVVGDAVKTWLDHGPRRTMGFCCGIRHAKKMAEAFNGAGIPARALSGEDKPAKRNEVLDEFRRGIFIALFSSDLLSEGVDLPFVSRLLMLRPTGSLVVYLQQIGRGCRIWPGKNDCELFDHAGNLFVHGHPYQERRYTLPDIDSRSPAEPVENLDQIWRCPICFCVVFGKPGQICPYCLTNVTTKNRKIQLVNGSLVEYDTEELARIEAEKEKSATERATNHDRIRTLFGVAMRKGMKGASARSFVFQQLGKFKNGAVPWEEFILNLKAEQASPVKEKSVKGQRQTTNAVSTSSSPRYNPLLVKKSSS